MLGYDKLLTETCSYQKYNGVNRYNEKDYEEVKEVASFSSYDLSNYRNEFTQDVELTKIIHIGNEFEPSPFDIIDGLEIKKITPVKGIKVPIIGWEIVL